MVVSANILQPLITVFEAILKFFHNTVGVGWGLSIVLMTIAVRAVMIPLAFKQIRSMQELQRHQPELKAIQQKYKEDKQRQQQELMKFYKENKINPLASCLPLAAQLPVFISLFYMLRKDLRTNICPAVQAFAHQHHHLAAGTTVPCGNHAPGAGFLFIHDLTNTAKGTTLVALIVLYVGTQFASTLMMQSPTMDQTQRRLMMLFPLFFVIFVINFPAGLLLYWITTNGWTILQQFIIRQRVGTVRPAVAVAADGGSSPSGRSPARNGAEASNGGASPVTAERAAGAGAALGSLLRGRAKAAEPAQVAAGGPRAAVPPPPPRKKKKRSGRRR